MTTCSAYDGEVLHYDTVNGARTAEIRFYTQMLSPNGSLLDVACGTGAITAVLATQCGRTVGIDNSEPMLRVARQRTAIVQFELADMRCFSVEGAFDTCICTFNTVQHLLTLPDFTGFLSSVRRALAPSGTLIFDILNPALEKLLPWRRDLCKGHFYQPALNREIWLFVATRYDRASQVNTVIYSYREGPAVTDREVTRTLFQMRAFFPAELDALLSLHGFKIIDKWGDYDGSVFVGNSRKQIVRCRPSS